MRSVDLAGTDARCRTVDPVARLRPCVLELAVKDDRPVEQIDGDGRRTDIDLQDPQVGVQSCQTTRVTASFGEGYAFGKSGTSLILVTGVAVGDGEAVEFHSRLAVVTSPTPVVEATRQQLTRFLRFPLLEQDDTETVEYGDLLRLVSADPFGRPL